MNIFLTVLGIIAAILILIFLIVFFLVVKLFVEYDTDTGKLNIYAKALFIRYDIFPANPLKQRKKLIKKIKNAEKTKKKSPAPVFTDEELKKLESDAKGASAEQKQEEKKPTLSERIKHFTQLVGSITAKIKILAPAILSAIKLEIKRLDVVVGAEDAAKASISYGAVCAAVEGLYAVGNLTKKLKVNKDVFVAVDYCGESFRADVALVLHVRVAKLIIPAIKAFIL